MSKEIIFYLLLVGRLLQLPEHLVEHLGALVHVVLGAAELHDVGLGAQVGEADLLRVLSQVNSLSNDR